MAPPFGACMPAPLQRNFSSFDSCPRTLRMFHGMPDTPETARSFKYGYLRFYDPQFYITLEDCSSRMKKPAKLLIALTFDTCYFIAILKTKPTKNQGWERWVSRKIE
jgi:hypothetical protein